MHRVLLLLLFVTLAALTASCGRQVQSTQRFLGIRPGMHTALHWNILANAVASRINEELMRPKYLNASIYVQHSCAQSGRCNPDDTFAFDAGFNDLLVTQLAQFGIRIMDAPGKADLIVEYKVQTLHHPPEQGWVASNFGIDLLDSKRGDHEMIITTSIIDKGRYIVRSSDIYTFNGADSWLYKDAGKHRQAADIRLTGPKRHLPPAASQGTSL
ncbi:MAG: hypothetical protein ACOX5Z_01115 [Desulfobulbus sp.]